VRHVPGLTAENPEDKVGVKGGQEDMAAAETAISREGVLSARLTGKALFANFSELISNSTAFCSKTIL
jgi:hypothetical protein